jgi:serine/threonine protein kinase
MSPELINPGKFGLEDNRPTKESDLYALGMVIYKVLSGRRPFAKYKHSAIADAVLAGRRPGRPRGKDGKLFTDEIWGALELCWKDQPQDRISASAVLLCLEGDPPPLGPSFNIDGDAETGNGDWSDTDSGMFSPFYPWPILNYPCAITGSLIAPPDNEFPLPPQTTDPRGGWLKRTWEIFGATPRKIEGR